MSTRYVPPGRRGKPEGVVEKTPAEDKSLVSLEEIRAYFWPATQDEVPRFPGHSTVGRTLHDAAANPGKLSYLVLFHGANPQWESDNIVFTKSNLHLLPAQLADDPSKAPPATGDENTATLSAIGAAQEDAPGGKVPAHGTESEAKLDSVKGTADGSDDPKNAQNPIAVFKHVGKAQVGRFLQFSGYYRIDKLAFLDPKSPELVKMLQKKWTKTDRFGNARPQERGEQQWKESLSHRWAVLKLKKDEVVEAELGVPKIERLPDLDPEFPEVVKKSVNEILAEMRMADQKSDSKESQ